MNGNDLNKLLGSMLENPDVLKGISNLGTNQSPSADTSSSDLESSVKSMMSVLNQTDDRRITLLNALKPYLSSQRAEGIDRAIRILKLTKLSEVIRNERN